MKFNITGEEEELKVGWGIGLQGQFVLKICHQSDTESK